jgi:Zn-dependent protease
VVPLIIYLETGSGFWRGLAFIGFFINLFNLAPVLPLDGGRACAALTTKIWLIAWLAMVVLAVYTLQPILFIIVLIGGMELVSRRKQRNSPQQQAYHRVRPRHRWAVGAVYLTLVLATGLATAKLYTPGNQLGMSPTHQSAVR